MGNNKSVKDQMIRKYGPECWIEKLHLRPLTDRPKVYRSKGQYRRMKQLTYHHIIERSKGGQTTEENGALLSAENHAWFHKQPAEIQTKLNSIFQLYKRKFQPAGDSRKATAEQAQLEDFSYEQFISRAKKAYNRAREKRNLRETIEREADYSSR